MYILFCFGLDTKDSRFSFSSEIFTTSSIFALFLLLLCLPFPFPPIDFGAPFKTNAFTDAPHFDRLNHSTNCWSFPLFSATAMTCSQIFVLLLMQLLSHLKDPSFPEETQKMRFADPATI